jgi:hypothetical protein
MIERISSRLGRRDDDPNIELAEELAKRKDRKGIAEIAAPAYQETIAPLLLEHLKTCRPKEVPQHAERAAPCMGGRYAMPFKAALELRLPELTAAQGKRVSKLLVAAGNAQ